MRTSELFGDFSIFRNLWCDRTNKEEGVEPVRTFFGQEGGSIFRDFVRTSIMDGPLSNIAPSNIP